MTPSDAVIVRLQTVEASTRTFLREVNKAQIDELTADAGKASLSALRAAELFTWRSDLAKAALVAGQGLPSPVTLSEGLMPCENGLYLFEAPLHLPGSGYPVSALSWCAFGGYSLVNAYTTTEPSKLPRFGPLWSFACYVLQHGQDVDVASAEDVRKVGTDNDFDMRKGGGSVNRFLVSSWLWLSQRVMVVGKETGNRASRKLADRAQMSSSVNVVILRRADRSLDPHADTSAIEWNCQWLVRGHWRQQYYPSTGERRPLWIEPYVKGPDDKPFKAPVETVFAVNR